MFTVYRSKFSSYVLIEQARPVARYQVLSTSCLGASHLFYRVSPFLYSSSTFLVRTRFFSPDKVWGKQKIPNEQRFLLASVSSLILPSKSLVKKILVNRISCLSIVRGEFALNSRISNWLKYEPKSVKIVLCEFEFFLFDKIHDLLKYF